MDVGDLVRWKSAINNLYREKTFRNQHGFGILLKIDVNHNKGLTYTVLWTKSGKKIRFLSDNLTKL